MKTKTAATVKQRAEWETRRLIYQFLLGEVKKWDYYGSLRAIVDRRHITVERITELAADAGIPPSHMRNRLGEALRLIQDSQT